MGLEKNMKVLWSKDRRQEAYLKDSAMPSRSSQSASVRAHQEPPMDLSGSDSALFKSPKHSNHEIHFSESSHKIPKTESSTIDAILEDNPSSNTNNTYNDHSCYCCICNAGSGSTLLRLEDSCDRLNYTFADMLCCCFGVKIPKNNNGMICEECAAQLLRTLSFKTMVLHIFEKPSPERRTSSHATIPIQAIHSGSGLIKKISSKKFNIQKRNIRDKKQLNNRGFSKEATAKKVIIPCVSCGQKYMSTIIERPSDFLCSRCKLKNYGDRDRNVVCVKCNMKVPANEIKEHLEMHARNNLKGRCRLRSVSQKPIQEKQEDVLVPRINRRFPCVRCPNTFTAKPDLLEHIRHAHGIGNVCNVCNRDMKTPATLEKHMKVHNFNR